MTNPAYIVVHGHGGTLIETLLLPKRLTSFECYWSDGNFYIPRRIAIPLRRLLNEGSDENQLFNSLRKLAVSNMLLSSLVTDDLPDNIKDMAVFRESTIIENFPSFSIPIGYESRKAAVLRLNREGAEELISLFSGEGVDIKNIDLLTGKFAEVARDHDNSMLTEEEVLQKIIEFFPGAVGGFGEGKNSSELADGGIVDSLLKLRDMEESGGDLDTVSSAVFYAHYLISKAATVGKELKYGKDFQFVFINYHEGLKPLGELPPGNIYMADMPISTIPDLPWDLDFLASKEIYLIRYEDHHPYTPEHLKMLERLKKSGMIGYFAMSGPLTGQSALQEELAPEELKCGADMVYDALIRGESWDLPAIKHLREITHCEDFASDRHPTGKIITELIKGGICKVELAQTLLECREKEDLLHRINDKKWYEYVLRQRYEAIEISDRFMEHIHLLEIERPDIGDSYFNGPPLNDGSDMPVSHNKRTEAGNRLHILLALAPKTKHGEPKLNIGRACEYFSDKIENIDYLFFCYGSSIVVGRRLNQADSSINLSTLFQKLGTANDGGHAGASVCSPESNPHYPHNILGRVSGANFAAFSRYISEKIAEELNVKVYRKENLSIRKNSTALSTGGKKVLYLILAALVTGAAVLLLRNNL